MAWVQNTLSGDVILTFGEHNFEGVLASLNDARQVDCATFNLGRSADDAVLQRLYSVSPEAKIRLLTNIPKRFENYY